MPKSCVYCLSSYYDNDKNKYKYKCGNVKSQEYLDEVDEAYCCEEYEGDWEGLDN